MDRKKVALKLMVVAIAVVVIFAVVPSEASAYTYNRWAAANYAKSNWNSNVPGSNYFGSNDCTNFVSNCLKAGGWPEVYEPWTYWQHLIFRKKPDAWYANSWTHWYSYTWGGANNFGKYVGIYSGRGYTRSLSYTPWYRYFKIGDIVQIDYNKDGVWDHTMIITDITHNDMYVTYHWASSKYVSLNYLKDNKYPNARFMGYNLKDRF